MNDSREKQARFTHLFSSPLTSMRGAIDLLRQPQRVGDDPVTRELLATLERSYARLRKVVEPLLAHAALSGDTVEIVVPLSAFGLVDEYAPDDTISPADGAPARPQEPAPAAPALPAPARTEAETVLLIDGAADRRATIGKLLSGAGYVLLEVADGADGVDQARQHRPDLILLYLGLPEGGQQVMQVLREDPETKAIPLLYAASQERPAAPLPPHLETISSSTAQVELLAVVQRTIAAAQTQADQAPALLIVDDDADIRRVVALKLQQEGYRIITAATGAEALMQAQKQPFDLIILDLLLPDIDGLSVLGALRANPATATTPIMLLSARNSPSEKVQGLQLGADDYVTKPFNPAELLARVQATLRRHERDAGANPSTRLPGNIAIERAIRRRIESSTPFAVCYTDLDNFKAYNDTYSFLKGDAVIQQTARVLRSAVESHGNPDDFVGHIGGDDFVVITSPERAVPISAHAIAQFDLLAPLFYDPETRRRGYIVAADRQGRQMRYPFVSLSIGIVSSDRHPITHLAEVAQRAVDPKKRAKEIVGSVYVVEK